MYIKPKFPDPCSCISSTKSLTHCLFFVWNRKVWVQISYHVWQIAHQNKPEYRWRMCSPREQHREHTGDGLHRDATQVRILEDVKQFAHQTQLLHQAQIALLVTKNKRNTHALTYASLGKWLLLQNTKSLMYFSDSFSPKNTWVGSC